MGALAAFVALALWCVLAASAVAGGFALARERELPAILLGAVMVLFGVAMVVVPAALMVGDWRIEARVPDGCYRVTTVSRLTMIGKVMTHVDDYDYEPIECPQ